MENRLHLTRYAWLSIATAILTIALKVTAYLMTGSVGLMSDAVESGVNLVAAILALVTLTVAAMPPDEEHSYGHAKAEYFSAGAEGTMILIAAGTIAVAAVQRIIVPQELERLGSGLIVSSVAAIANLVVARILLKAGRQYQSIALEAGAQHLMSDVWTSGGVLLGVGAVFVTGWQLLDPLIALVVALQVLVSGFRLVRQAIRGLMDSALPAAELAEVIGILDKYKHEQDIYYHALRSRRSGPQRFVSVHIQVPGAWSVQRGHTLLEELEKEVRQAIPQIVLFTHLEPAEDPASWHDIELHRTDT